MPFQVSITTGQTTNLTTRQTSARHGNGRRKCLEKEGVEIADVVQRCLGCSFGSKPSFTDKRFRGVVYAGVIQPLRDYLKKGQLLLLLEGTS